jgi:hypothetical protein
MDLEDGSRHVVDTIFRQQTATTYPLLLQASKIGNHYGFTQHNYAVIDHEGILLYRSSGNIIHRFDEEAIRTHIKAALNDLDTALLATEETTVEVSEVSEPAATELSEQTTAQNETPQDFHLERNYPNPFNAGTTIRFSTSDPAQAELRVYDILGRVVADLALGRVSAGSQSVHWDGRDTKARPVASGTYFYRLSIGGKTTSRKMLLLR